MQHLSICKITKIITEALLCSCHFVWVRTGFTFFFFFAICISGIIIMHNVLLGIYGVYSTSICITPNTMCDPPPNHV